VMPEGRCDLILLGWTAFVGFNLISDFLWSSNQPGRAQSLPASFQGFSCRNLLTWRK